MKALAPPLASLASVAFLAFLALHACSSVNPAIPAQAEGGPLDASEGDAGVDAPPAGCDPRADPKDAPKCVVSDFGVFVDATGGADGNPGTKELPTKTIAAALGKLGGKPRLYLCEGTYPEHV